MAGKSLAERLATLAEGLGRSIPFLKPRLPAPGHSAEPFDSLEDGTSIIHDDLEPNAALDLGGKAKGSKKSGSEVVYEVKLPQSGGNVLHLGIGDKGLDLGFESAVLAALDHDGNIVWRKEIVPFKFDVAFAAIAQACGYARVLSSDDPAAFAAALAAPRTGGPLFVHFRIRPGAPDKLPRPTVTPAEVYRRLQRWLA